MALVRKAFEARGQKDLESAACRKFVKENAYWLDEYAEFCAKRDGNEPEYHKWIQFHLDKQRSNSVQASSEYQKQTILLTIAQYTRKDMIWLNRWQKTTIALWRN